MNYYLTKEKLENLKKEIERLKTKERAKIAEQLKQAIEYGDLRENAAYQVVKDNQADLERKIFEMDNIIKNASIIKKKKADTVQIGSIIKVKKKNTEYQYTILGPQESNPEKNLISYKSPLGMAFLGKKKGEIVNIQTLHGEEILYKIIDII